MVYRREYLKHLSAGAVRLLLAVAGALAVGSQAAGWPAAAFIAGLYVAFALGFWATSPGHPRWLAFPVALIDVAAAAAFMWLAPAPFPSWVLLLFPLLLAASSSVPAALLAGVLSLAVYAASRELAGAALDTPTVLWPLAVLALATTAVVALRSSWIGSAREQRARAQSARAEENALRERALARIAGDLASFDETVIKQALVGAVNEALRAACRIEPAVSTDGTVPGAPDLSPLTQAQDVHRSTLPLDGGLQLEVTRHRPFIAPELDWLRRLCGAGSHALNRAAQHAQLAASEEQLRAAWQSSPMPAVLKTASGEPLHANEAYLSLRLEEAHGAVSTDGTGEYEVTAGDPPRTFVPVEATLDNGSILTTYREITREREMLQARDELLSLVGHELRGPLTSIHGFSQMMARSLDVVRQQAGQLDRLIGDLMSKSALERGQLSLDLQRIDLSQLLNTAAERFTVAHPDRQLTRSVQSGNEIQADPARLNQVVDNLLNNAAKYSPPEAPIEIGLERRPGEVLIWVKDAGAGIAPEHLERLFDRFYRVPGADSQQPKGLGLGLAVVQDLVTAHGGRVWAESKGPGQGSIFYVALPVENAVRVQAEPGLLEVSES